METTDFKYVLAEAAEEVGLNPDALSVAEFTPFVRFARKRLERAWYWHFWPDLTRTEQRWFALEWNSATTYASSDIVFHPLTDTYYQALTASTGQDPSDGTTTNLAYWTEAETSSAGTQYDNAATYEQGDVVYYGGLNYQLFATSATGVLPTDSGSWGLLTPFNRYIDWAQANQLTIGLVAGAWSQNPNVSTRGAELNWSLTHLGINIKSAVTSAWVAFRLRCPVITGANYSATKAYVIGQQIYYENDGDVLPPGGALGSANYRVYGGDIQYWNADTNKWHTARMQGDPPQLAIDPVGTDPDPGGTTITNYTVGNFYTCIADTSVGENPVNTPASWAVVQLPRSFHRYLVLGLAADWLRGPGGATPEEFGAREMFAQEELDNQKSLLVGQQSQAITTRILTR